MHTKTTVLALSLSCMLWATPGMTATPVTAPGSKASTQADSRELTDADQSFVENVTQSGLAEIAAGKMALQEATEKPSKAYAQKMIDAHTAMNQALAKVIEGKGYTPPTEPSLTQRAELKVLGMKKGAEFDEMYANNYGVSQHNRTILSMRNARTQADDPALRRFADEYLPKVEGYVNDARALRKSDLGK